MDNYYVLGLGIIYSGVLLGYFKTKKPGFGPYNTSILIIILVLMLTSIGFVTGKIDPDDTSKIIFALIGFAAGLFVKREAASKTNMNTK